MEVFCNLRLVGWHLLERDIILDLILASVVLTLIKKSHIKVLIKNKILQIRCW